MPLPQFRGDGVGRGRHAGETRLRLQQEGAVHEFPAMSELPYSFVMPLKLVPYHEYLVQGQLFPKTWSDCYSCKVTFPSKQTCQQSWRFNKQPCHAQPFLTLSVSMYAAQLSWWFGHFPKSRFMFINSDDLHGKDTLPLLNTILDFAEVDGPFFQEKNLQNVWGYNGGYNKSELSDLDRHTVTFLELFFRQADHDLKLLLSKTGYPGLKHELSHHSKA